MHVIRPWDMSVSGVCKKGSRAKNNEPMIHVSCFSVYNVADIMTCPLQFEEFRWTTKEFRWNFVKISEVTWIDPRICIFYKHCQAFQGDIFLSAHVSFRKVPHFIGLSVTKSHGAKWISVTLWDAQLESSLFS